MRTILYAPSGRRANSFYRLPLLLLLLITAAACSGLGGDPVEPATEASEGVTPPPGSETPTSTVTEEPPGLVTRLMERLRPDTTLPPSSQPVSNLDDPITLDLVIPGGLPNLDPQTAASDAQFDFVENLFAGLTNYNLSTNMIEPELAERWEVADNGRTWTFYLRDDVYWLRPDTGATGTGIPRAVQPVRPVVADDVVFAIQRVCNRDVETGYAFILFIIEGCQAVHTTTGATPTAADLARIGVRAVDATTLEIRLTKPAGYLLTMTSMWLFSPVPRDMVLELGNEWTNNLGTMGSGWQTPDNLLTSGPFFLAEAYADDAENPRVVLLRNPLWPLDRGGNADVVNIRFLNDTQEAFTLWQGRELDVVALPVAERDAFLQRSPDRAKIVTDQTLFYLGFNFDSQVFREPELRQAFSAAIDRQQLVEDIYGGEALPMRHLSPPGVFGAVAAEEVGVGYSPDYARQRMSDSTARNCSLVPPFTFLVSSIDLSLRQAEYLRDMWGDELNCPEDVINIEQAPFGALLANTRADATSGRPDMWELAWAPYFPDAHNLLTDLLHCQDGDNRQRRECSEVDTLMRRAGSTTDPAERQAAYRQIENLFFGEGGIFPLIPLYVRSQTFAAQGWLQYNPALFGGEQYDTYVVDSVLKELERGR